MNEPLQDLLDAIAEARESAHVYRYLPRLETRPGQCLLLYVTQPTAESELSECITVETPVEIGLRMMGGLDPTEIIGIFPVDQAEQALLLAQSALAKAQGQDYP